MVEALERPQMADIQPAALQAAGRALPMCFWYEIKHVTVYAAHGGSSTAAMVKRIRMILFKRVDYKNGRQASDLPSVLEKRSLLAVFLLALALLLLVVLLVLFAFVLVVPVLH